MKENTKKALLITTTYLKDLERSISNEKIFKRSITFIAQNKLK